MLNAAGIGQDSSVVVFWSFFLPTSPCRRENADPHHLLASENSKWKLRVKSVCVKRPIHSAAIMQPFRMHNGQEELGNLLL
jgi:hypothetical protein